METGRAKITEWTSDGVEQKGRTFNCTFGGRKNTRASRSVRGRCSEWLTAFTVRTPRDMFDENKGRAHIYANYTGRVRTSVAGCIIVNYRQSPVVMARVKSSRPADRRK